MNINVKKFGGTSVGTLDRIEAVADLVLRDAQKNPHQVVVASAMAGETNRLVSLANTLNPFYRGPAYDMLVSSGEQVSIALLAMACEKRGLKVRPLLAYQLGLYTDSLFSKARIQRINTELMSKLLEQKIIPIVAGFQGIDDEDNLTTLGRGGSDTTAVALACALKARECEIYTDVPAVFTADPRLVKKAREIPQLCFEEMMEMASLGSKVLHIRCVELAMKYNVPLHVRSSFMDREGTWICAEGALMENPVVSAVTHEANTAIFKLSHVPTGPGFVAKLFDELTKEGAVVDIITQSESESGGRLAFSVSQEDTPLAQKAIKKCAPTGCEVSLLEKKAKLSIVGVGMRNHPGVAARFFKVFAENDIPLHLVTTSEIKISTVIDEDYLQKAAEVLHTEFELDQSR